MEPRVVLVNGPAGVGKSTVARRLAETARNGVCIGGDDLKGFVVSREEGAVEHGLSYVGGAVLTDVFLEAGYELVMFEFVFERGAHVQRYLDELRADVDVHLLTLWAPLATITRREGGRVDRHALGARVSECWNKMAAHHAELGHIVQADASIDEVVAEVLRALEDNRGLIMNKAA